jgi:hypothetical protein
MRIVEQQPPADQMVIEVKEARYIGDHAIRVFFTDGSEQLVDFKPFITRSQHPSVKKYADERLFAAFDIVHGNLNWNDYELIFPVADLHEGKI